MMGVPSPPSVTVQKPQQCFSSQMRFFRYSAGSELAEQISRSSSVVVSSSVV